ncbi:ELL-associated factor [Cordyceps javanica]|uniref:ELL-associated factor n=1 Tax=Cordyceps javanica TaxID=43265 RepID=A0A545VUI2_9HYPO|nr:ELL-associated factor [Cordyceps javanica]TQW05383.1 ELL-associated factor [Cordyceps javanica]
MAALIDPTVAGKYPVILGDSLTGEDSNEIFTGVRYNHKPELSSPDAPERARLKPSVPGKTSSYDLTYTDEDDDSYAFTGPRSTDDDQYVLYFDPSRQAFVLDKVDSTFNMNLTRMPGSADPEELSRRFPHLDVEDRAEDSINVRGPAQKNNGGGDKPASAAGATQAKRKVDKKPPKNLAMPVAAAPAPAPKPKSKKPADEDDEDDDDDDDDGGLMIEYPEGPPATAAAAAAAAKHNDFSPAFPTQRRFDDYMNQRESEADDADGESDDDMDMDFKLPSPVNAQNGHATAAAADNIRGGQDAAGSDDEDNDDGGVMDLEADLEKEMEIAFEDLANSQEEGGGRDDESEISEED